VQLGGLLRLVAFATLDLLDDVAHVGLQVEQVWFERLIGRQLQAPSTESYAESAGEA
jgi:hypothetical protein